LGSLAHRLLNKKTYNRKSLHLIGAGTGSGKWRIKMNNLVRLSRVDMPPEPVWKPLREYLEKTKKNIELDEFVYVCRSKLVNDIIIHQYKHRISRRYLNLDNNLQTWRLIDRENGFQIITPEKAIKELMVV
jgi:hypothetical protein